MYSQIQLVFTKLVGALIIVAEFSSICLIIFNCSGCKEIESSRTEREKELYTSDSKE